MTAANLGIVFGPTLMRPKLETFDLVSSQKQATLILTMISEYDCLFGVSSICLLGVCLLACVQRSFVYCLFHLCEVHIVSCGCGAFM